MDTPSQERDDSIAAALSPDNHGSGVRLRRSPTQELASPELGSEVQASPTVTAAATLQDDANPTDTATVVIDPSTWTTPEVVNWLEELSWVPQKGIDLITTEAADGEFMMTLIDSNERSDILQNEFGIESSDSTANCIRRQMGVC